MSVPLLPGKYGRFTSSCQWRAMRPADSAGEAGLDFEDLVTALAPPPNRVGQSHEHHLYEGAVMLAYAMHLLRTQGAGDVRIHRDGEHGKQFDFTVWLGRRDFAKISNIGSTAYGGAYRNSAGQAITVHPKSGLGDVVAEVENHVTSAECKGGIINTRHPGQISWLYRYLCDTVGLLMAAPSQGRQIAVVPLPSRHRPSHSRASIFVFDGRVSCGARWSDRSHQRVRGRQRFG